MSGKHPKRPTKCVNCGVELTAKEATTGQCVACQRNQADKRRAREERAG